MVFTEKSRQQKNLIKILHTYLCDAILTGVGSEAPSNPHLQFSFQV